MKMKEQVDHFRKGLGRMGIEGSWDLGIEVYIGFRCIAYGTS